MERLGFTVPVLNLAECEALEIRVKYAGYIERAERQLAAEARARELSLQDLDYDAVSALSNEAREKLRRLRPGTLAQASRIPGVRHADVSSLLVHLRRHPAPPNEAAPI